MNACPLAIALVMLAAGPGAAQQKKIPSRPAKTTTPASRPAAASDKWPIATLTVEGNKIYTAEQILTVAGLKAGQAAGKEDFEAARDRLVASGVFETVGYRFAPAGSSGNPADAYAASFQVVEAEPVFPVRLEDFEVPAAEIDSWLAKRDPFYGARLPATNVIIKRHVKDIEEYFAGKGKPTKVVGKVVSDAPNQFAIVFRPSGSEPAIAEVKFEGNTVLTSQALLNKFAGVAYGTPYREPSFRQMLDAGIRPLYEARGRIRVSFSNIRTMKATVVEGVIVIVKIEEGPSYDLGEVRIDGRSPAPAKDLLKIAAFKTGDLANFDEINEGLDRIKRRLRREGYMRNTIDAERKIDDQKKTVDLILRIDEGPQFVFGTLTLAGLDLHGEAAIKKLWALKEGKPFNADYPDYFLQRIREDGVFDNLGKTRSSLDVNEQTHTVNVTLSFK